MVTEFLQHGLKSVPVALRLCGALLRNQGISGSARSLSGLRGQGRSGKRLVEQALSDGQRRDDLRNAQWRKVIAAGLTVAAAVVTPSGPGVVFVDVDARGTSIVGAEYFRNSV